MARAGVIVKGVGAIETLGQARTVLFDKTGTLTVGTPEVRDIITRREWRAGDLLRLAASVDRLSTHILGAALTTAATEAGVDLTMPVACARSPARESRARSTGTSCSSEAERSCAAPV